MDLNTLTAQIINAAIRVHRELGPGLLESVYQICLEIELKEQGLKVEKEVALPILYKNRQVHHDGFRLDLLVEDCIVLELKSVEKVQPVHFRQLLTYLRLANKPLGLLLNFNELLLKNGITRVANGPERA